jgi:hypothetical protein
MYPTIAREKPGRPLCSLVSREIAALTHGSHVHVKIACGLRFAELREEAARVELGIRRTKFCRSSPFLRRTLPAFEGKALTIEISVYSLAGGRTRNSAKSDEILECRPRRCGNDGNEGSNPVSSE